MKVSRFLFRFWFVAAVIAASLLGCGTPATQAPAVVSTPETSREVSGVGSLPKEQVIGTPAKALTVPSYAKVYDVLSTLWQEGLTPSSKMLVTLYNGTGDQTISEGLVGAIVPLDKFAPYNFHDAGQSCEAETYNIHEWRQWMIVVPVEVSTKQADFLAACKKNLTSEILVYAVYAKVIDGYATITWQEEIWGMELQFIQK